MDIYNCQKCSTPFNTTSRKPMVLPCCDETICQACIDSVVQPQESKLKCPFDEEEVQITNIKQNKAITKGLFKVRNVGIHCDKHLTA